MTVASKIMVYEVNGVEAKPIPPTELKIESHSSRRGMVVLKFPNAPTITVSRADLDRATVNATNWGI